MMFNFDPARRNFQPKGDPRERWCINNRGNPFFSRVIRGGEIAHKEPGPPAQTGVSGGPLKRILISDCCYLNAQWHGQEDQQNG
ncbi:hypothetical protein ALC62_13889 [Cyphomyrmex costatus]|uniref:Uncharacterized protein n=1 Tax=Cyphomyrmex costatus TaxID=456900 RepID=A0A195C5K1_9HYME|nr:hypothetical protein ALC62_13889 [Cyphomyrmex costatus]